MFALLVSLENDFVAALKDSPARYPFNNNFCNNTIFLFYTNYVVHFVVRVLVYIRGRDVKQSSNFELYVRIQICNFNLQCLSPTVLRPLGRLRRLCPAAAASLMLVNRTDSTNYNQCDQAV